MQQENLYQIFGLNAADLYKTVETDSGRLYTNKEITKAIGSPKRSSR